MKAAQIASVRIGISGWWILSNSAIYKNRAFTNQFMNYVFVLYRNVYITCSLKMSFYIHLYFEIIFIWIRRWRITMYLLIRYFFEMKKKSSLCIWSTYMFYCIKLVTVPVCDMTRCEFWILLMSYLYHQGWLLAVEIM